MKAYEIDCDLTVTRMSHLVWTLLYVTIFRGWMEWSSHFHNLFHELVKHWQILTKRLLVSCTSCKCFHIFVKNIYLWFNISLCHKGRNQVNIFSSLSPISYFSERTLPWLNHLFNPINQICVHLWIYYLSINSVKVVPPTAC